MTGFADLFDALPDGDKSIMSGQGICDFCSPPLPSAWVYPCKTFWLPEPPGLQPFGKKHRPRSEGDWGACKTCAELIEAHDIDNLVKRCGHTHPVLVDLQREVLKRFFKNRTREARFSVDGQVAVVYDAVIIVPDEKSEG